MRGGMTKVGFEDAGLFDPRFAPMLDSMSGAVSVAKWLRRQVVALEIEGSNPFAHPTSSVFAALPGARNRRPARPWMALADSAKSDPFRP